MNAITMERFRRQFNACFGRVPSKPKPLTGIEKEALEEKVETLEEEFQRVFRVEKVEKEK